MQEHAQHTTPRGLVDEVKATLSDARRRAILDVVDILERRLDELFPVDTSELFNPADDWDLMAKPPFSGVVFADEFQFGEEALPGREKSPDRIGGVKFRRSA